MIPLFRPESLKHASGELALKYQASSLPWLALSIYILLGAGLLISAIILRTLHHV